MSSISSVSNAFGYTNSVLANDDTLKAAPPASAATPTAAVAPAATTPAAKAAATATPTQKVELGNLQWESQLANALLPATSLLGGASSVFFSGGSMANLLNTQGTAAMAYLTPQGAPPLGSVVNASA
jgi:hypothetical protein